MITITMPLAAHSPIQAEIQFALDSFHDFTFTHYTLAMSVHTATHVNHKFNAHTEPSSTASFQGPYAQNVLQIFVKYLYLRRK